MCWQLDHIYVPHPRLIVTPRESNMALILTVVKNCGYRQECSLELFFASAGNLRIRTRLADTRCLAQDIRPQNQMEQDYAARLALDWADRKLAWALKVTGENRIEQGDLEHTLAA